MINQDVFIDTNILVYSKLEDSSYFELASKGLRNIASSNRIFINYQVLREYWNTLSRITSPMKEISIDIIYNDIMYLKSHFIVLSENQNSTKYLYDIAKTYNVRGKQIHDANIVATMVANNIKYLFTNNVKDIERYSSLINVIPLE